MKKNTKTDDELRAIFEVAKQARVQEWEKQKVHKVLDVLSRVICRMRNLDMNVSIEIIGSVGKQGFNLCDTIEGQNKTCPISGILHLGNIQHAFTIRYDRTDNCILYISEFHIPQEVTEENIRTVKFFSKETEFEAKLTTLLIKNYAREVVLNSYDTNGVFNQPYTPIKRVVPLHLKDPSLFKKM